MATSQIDSFHSGVHLEPIGAYQWRLIGKRTMYIARVTRLVHEPFRPTGRKVKRPTWVAKETPEDEGIPFGTAAEALAHAYHRAL